MQSNQLTAEETDLTVPADPYAGKSPQELLALTVAGDKGAKERLMRSFGSGRSRSAYELIPDDEIPNEVAG